MDYHPNRSDLRTVDRNIPPRICSWLHISDIHFRAADSWRDSSARDALVRYLDGRARSWRQLDFVFCTGDIGFGDVAGQPLEDQYKAALAFFERILSITNVSRDRLFVVPGNHDVSRSAVNAYAEAEYRKRAKEHWVYEREINAGLASQSKEYIDALRRLQPYKAFFRTLCPHVRIDTHLHYAHRVRLPSIDVQILGLNSAWCCNGSEEHRDVWVGAPAQTSLLERDDKSFRIGLIHHPLEWITKADSAHLEGRMGRDLHVLLHGHEHEFREHQFEGGFPVIGTGAVSADSQLEHGVVVCELDFDRNQLSRTLLLYSPRTGSWERSTRCDRPLPFPSLFSADIKSSPTAAGSVRSYRDCFVRLGRLGDAGGIDVYDEGVEPSASAHNRDSQYFRHLWSDSMGPHAVERIAGDPSKLHYEGVASSTRIVQKDNLDAFFLRNVVKPCDLSATANASEEDIRDAIVSFDVFVKEISDPPRSGTKSSAAAPTDSENRIRYLLGDAGIGKTLTVLKVVDILRERSADEHGYRPVPVYVDLHQDRSWLDLEEPAKALHGTIDRIGRALHAQLPTRLQMNSPFSQVSFATTHELDAAMIKLGALYMEARLTPLVIFDNGDRFFFENARYRFFPDFARRRDWHLDDTFVALVDRFVSESSLGKIGASVLFVCRKYVYSHCLRMSDGADPNGPVRRNHKVYQVIGAPPDSVLESRFELIQEAIGAIEEGKYRNAAMFQERLLTLRNRFEMLKRDSGDGHGSMLQTVWSLTHQGHRSWLNFLAALPVDVGPGAEVADRIFGSPYMLLRLYITNMRKRYTQRHGHFPNLYLNDALVMPSEIHRDAHGSHVHSYWLKYLILKFFVRRRDQERVKQVNSEDLIRKFVDVFKYEEHLVRLALGSLADPATSMCLNTVNPDRLLRHVEVLQLSDRGRILIGDTPNRLPLCFSFDYLQLVTDDYLLALPKQIASRIFVDTDLGHTLKSGAVYAKGARNTLRKKIPAVLYFIKLLEHTFFAEANYRGNLAHLEQDGMIPNFAQVADGLLNAIARIGMHFEETADAEPLPNHLAAWKEISEDSTLRSAVLNYYSRPEDVTL